MKELELREARNAKREEEIQQQENDVLSTTKALEIQEHEISEKGKMLEIAIRMNDVRLRDSENTTADGTRRIYYVPVDN